MGFGMGDVKKAASSPAGRALAGAAIGGATMGPAGAVIGGLAGYKSGGGKIPGMNDVMGGIAPKAFNPGQYAVDKGAFGTADMDALRQAMASQASARQGLDVGGDVRAQQMGLAQALQAQMAGQGPSLAQSQLRQATDRNLAQAMAMQQQRGANPFLAQRNITNAAAMAGQQAAAQSADLRMQEQLAAQQQLGGLTGQMRGADIQAQQLKDQAALAYADQQAKAIQNAMASRQGYEQLMSQNMNAYNQSKAAAVASQNQMNAGIIGGGLGALGAIGAAVASDKELKKDIKSADEKKLDDFIEKLKAYQYEYKNPKFGEGEHTSVMAQDLEKSDIGSTAVLDTPEGKMVDYGKLAAPMLAHQKMMSDKIKDLEEALKAKKGGK